MPLKLKEKSLDEMKKDAISRSVAERGYKNGGMVKEYGGKEKYASKGAMKKHEGKEGPKKEKMEGMGKGYSMGGKVLVKGKNC